MCSSVFGHLCADHIVMVEGCLAFFGTAYEASQCRGTGQPAEQYGNQNCTTLRQVHRVAERSRQLQTYASTHPCADESGRALTHCRTRRVLRARSDKKPQPRRRVGSADDLFEFVQNALG